ncbi:unnamed protein product [Penicillium nalgiovense]|uniref:Uncharacterized protein n=2 Tax=Penicillium nalgiovense TaxID=60175 RepID=A0A9W4HRY3_PENNA|nr:unnamed protein product [Penicillium nalgiovense]CAG8043751.1 unnamed protein product [Penicillium nalgiovense]CAG8065068.1 unnamed protein product [Penicillium nalgiovense]CAG8067654.1 unnamed protein product [Penicillium nalgiovense]CAG8095302.1 unnamed protein product [Penicillium nalgiovense]
MKITDSESSSTGQNPIKRPPTKEDNLGLNVPFCIQVFQRSKHESARLFVPTVWGEFGEIGRKLLAAPWASHRPSHYQCRIHCTAFRVTFYERSVKSPTLSPFASVASHIKFPNQRGCGEGFLDNNRRSDKHGKNRRFNKYRRGKDPSPVGTDSKYDVENIASLVNTPVGQYVFDLIRRVRDMAINEGFLPTKAEVFKMHVLHDLRKLTKSIDQNIWIWMLTSAGDTIAEFLMACSPSNAYTENYKAKLVGDCAAAVHAAYCLDIDQHEAQDRNVSDLVGDLQEICQYLPDDEYLTSMVNGAAEVLEAMKID